MYIEIYMRIPHTNIPCEYAVRRRYTNALPLPATSFWLNSDSTWRGTRLGIATPPEGGSGGRRQLQRAATRVGVVGGLGRHLAWP